MSLFGIFGRKSPPNDFGQLNDRVTQLEYVQLDSKKRFRALELEWESAYDKIHKAMQRLNKRARDAEKAEDAPSRPNAEPAGVAPRTDFRSRVLARRRHG